ncbi:peptidyl-prolyl cis-trans isomerase, FKBP-type [Monoraphidium neglectum]|uniref:peptidylprolyl isomerase n=1 Tax=Monoraphidium neglectum TaxID=145388 RepID=A0A0D2MRF1_9CHLO|nr:peptidyl-prolyl cis-trans isomerase, FKBP-type [Monoraphidium neglectum]KIZ03037.1 peptidyl-prolyl cis-trans isomerase, FKBP-type [Monoraphidium neglectum]|eukprot:XP_013902056.1 peptidyl-prolyl cis-trans isomerase, FKBP-type [Monoraphidium neglectum]
MITSRAIVLVLCALCMGLGALAQAKKVEKEVTKLQIGVKFKPEGCDEARKAKPGDTVSVHYAGRLVDGTEFDNSFKRGEPITFELGQGRVIKGWDRGINGMCVGEKRKLKIPPHLGYGDSGAGASIPGKATLIFDTELVKIA